MIQYTSVDLNNEEEIKTKILLKYIEDLGFTKDDITLEKTFSVRLGKKFYYKEDGKNVYPKRATREGRLDILCHKGDLNLFILELKAEKIDISQDDINQGISYARLVHPIVPFVIVTNGKDTQVIDTITKKGLNGTTISSQSKFWQDDCKVLSAKEEIQLRYEALKNFIGYSSENIRLFSYSQIEDRMLSLKGNLGDITKKYVPELFLKRHELIDRFASFMQGSVYFEIDNIALAQLKSHIPDNNTLQALKGIKEQQYSDSVTFLQELENVIGKVQTEQYKSHITKYARRLNQCFALIGEAGVGKTNCMCDLVEHFSDQYIVFFFNTKKLVNDPFESIAADFNWFFSPDIPATEIIPRLESLAENANTKICFFFDAVDEAAYKNFNLVLDDFIGRLRKFPNIKVCISCKFNEWNNFLSISGEPSDLSSTLGHNTFTVERFNNEELEQIEQRYKQIFSYKGDLVTHIREECKLGFMLRVLAETYQGRPLPSIGVDSKELMRQYLDKKLEDTGERQVAANQLRKIGEALIAQERSGETSLGDFVEEYELLDMLGCDQLHPKLFAFNILDRTTTDDGIGLIGFYYTRLRDYIITIHSFRLSGLNNESFHKKLPGFFNGHIGEEAIRWYASIATDEHKNIHQQYRASLFLEKYVNIIQQHFPNLKESFYPYTSGEVGLVMNSIAKGHYLKYGFRPLGNQNKESVVIVEPDANSTTKQISKMLHRLGAQIVVSKDEDFLEIHPQKAAVREVKNQLGQIIQEGQLNESRSISLAKEKIISILDIHGQKFGFQRNGSSVPLSRTIIPYPIVFNEIECSIKEMYIRDYYENKIVHSYVSQWKYDENGFPFLETKPENEEELQEKVAFALQENDIVLPDVYVVDKLPASTLFKIMQTLRNYYTEISNPLLPLPDIPSEEAGKRMEDRTGGDLRWSTEDMVFSSYSEAQLKNYVEAFFYLFIQEYTTLVEFCFPSLKDEFLFYRLQPIYLYAEVQTKKKAQRSSLVYTCKLNTNNEVAIEASINPPVSKIPQFPTEEFKTIHRSSIEDIFRYYLHVTPLDSMLKRHYINTHDIDGACILRNWVYHKIEEELIHIIQKIQ